MCTTGWKANEDNFWTDVVDPIQNFGEIDREIFYEEEIICSSSGRGRNYLIEIPRIPHKYNVVRNQVHEPATTENREHAALPAMPAQLNYLNKTNKPTKGRGRARQLKHYALTCQENNPGNQSNNVTMPPQPWPFNCKNPVPKTLKPHEMFFQKSFGSDNWDLSSSQNYERRSFGKLPPSKEETNFDDEFPMLSSQSSSSSTDDLNRLFSGASTKKKGQQPSVHKQFSSGDDFSETTSKQNLKHLSATVLSPKKDVPKSSNNEFSVTVKSRSENLEQNLTSVSPLYWTAEEDQHSDVLSTSTVSQRESESYSSSLNDIYYSSLTSADEGEEMKDRTNNSVTPTPLSQKVVNETGSDAKTWSLTGSDVIQLDGLPHGCDLCHLEELIASFGTVKDSEVMFNKDTSSVRFRLDSCDACEWVVSCLHDTDSIFPDFNCILTCFQVDK